MQPSASPPFPYSPITRRPRLEWPGGARVALWVIPNIEFFHLDLPFQGSGVRPPEVPAYAVRDYGARVGVWRIMDVLSSLGIRATVALNSRVCDQHPQVIEEAVKLGWEFMGHCQTNSQRLNELPPEQERQVVFDTMDRIQQATGVRPAGWLGAGLHETWDTLDYLLDAGCRYVADWVVDDEPIPMTVGGRKIISLPYTLELNDMRIFARANLTPHECDMMVRRQFDVLYREGAESGRVMAVALHPFLVGQPHRIHALRSALEYVMGHDGVWAATGSEIVDHYLAHAPQGHGE